MGQMLIRKLDDKVIKKIKARAKANGRSAEVRDLLTKAVASTESQRRNSLVELIGSGGRSFRNSEEINAWIRELRDEWDR